MLSETSPGLMTRPKPPGSRRSSAKQEGPLIDSDEKVLDQQQKSQKQILSPSPSLSNSQSLMVKSDSGTFERDLDLDLSSDLTDALRKSMQGWPQGKRFGVAKQIEDSELAVIDANDDETKGKEMLQSPLQGQHRSTASVSSQNSISDTSLDADWMGELPREELEKLLYESRQIIKERERDLGIAAAIGKALLEKNISLRNRHEGIVSRFSSMRSMESFIGDQTSEITTPLPRYTPPQSDLMLVGKDGKENIDQQRTPRQTDLTGSNSGYFEGFSASPSVKGYSQKDFWNTSGNQFITSIPESPTTSRFADTSISSLPSSETQRRLDLISQQNDELLEQISQLQAESEGAKREGGKRQKRLIREIDGLRTELEAAQARTVELERNAEAQKKAMEDNQEQSQKKVWRRRGRMPWQNASNNESKVSDINDENVDNVSNKNSISIIPQAEIKHDEKDIDTKSLSGRSESSVSAINKPRTQTEGERAIVAQLMAKVRELEEINMSLIKDAHERDGRIGRFLEDSERLRDMYDAVENEANSNFSPSASVQDLTIADLHFSPISSAAASPVSKRRRAPGNRHLIENRRMVRAAMQTGLDTKKPFDSKSDDSAYNSSSNNSSLHSSPAKSRRSKRLQRPRILITPSCEDLMARSKADQIAGWQDVEYEVEHSQDQMVRSSSDPTLYDGSDLQSSQELSSGRRLLYRASESQLGSMANIAGRNVQRSLGSELQNVYGGHNDRFDDENYEDDDDAPQQDGEEQLENFKRFPSTQKAPRKSASHASLRSVSEAGSDIADLKWSNGSTLTLRTDYDLPELDTIPLQISPAKTPTKQMALIPQSQSLSQMIERPDGEWHSYATQNLIPKGSLRNDVETSHDNYSILEKFTRSVPVHWADDEDFGKPITERDAIKLGLLDKSRESTTSSKTKKTRGMLSWISPLRKRSFKNEELPLQKPVSTKRQIETAEDVERREALERLLRAKRVAALHDRILTGQISTEEARRKGAFDGLESDEEFDQSVLSAFSFEKEVTRRTLAYRSGKQRQTSKSPRTSPKDSSSPSRFPRGSSSHHSLYDDHKKPEEPLVNKQEEDLKGMEESFEFVDHDPTTKKVGTDYYPITLRERYRPDMVRQRVHRFSNETITWAMAWATFSIVMVLAFVSAFARGPKRILSGQQQI